MSLVHIGNDKSATLAYRYFIFSLAEYEKMAEKDMRGRELYLGKNMTAFFTIGEAEIFFSVGHREFKHIRVDMIVATLENTEWLEFTPKKKVYPILKKFFSKAWKICFCGGAPIEGKVKCLECTLTWFYRKDDRCPVCLIQYGRWTKLSCGHIIHSWCLMDMINKGINKCPLCRKLCHKKYTDGWPYFEDECEYSCFISTL